MSVGDGIFLSGLFLGVVGLYAATKSRWNWMRIAKWGLILPIASAAILLVAIWGYGIFQEMPAVQEQFEGIKLNATPADVRFLKGEPLSKQSSKDHWVYDVGSSSANPESTVVVVQFRDDRIRYIAYLTDGRSNWTPALLGFSFGDAYDSVLEKLGPPSHISTSTDGLNRILSFEKFKVFFGFELGKITTYGIYDPTTGPMKFANEAVPTVTK
ncbi:hypothetical protein P3G55_19010 [Leptospira sp. 96542]|nr:hypothetical protein [Leptospira sp. 96542]